MINTDTFIEKVVDLLVIVDSGMQGLAEPLPENATKHLRYAIAAFGEQALPALHSRIGNSGGHFLIDVLGDIGHQSSIPYLIEAYKTSSFISGAAALIALRKIGGEPSYQYLLFLLKNVLEGNHQVVNTVLEIELSCLAMGDWASPEALLILKRILESEESVKVKKSAVEALSQSDEGAALLKELSRSGSDKLTDLLE